MAAEPVNESAELAVTVRRFAEYLELERRSSPHTVQAYRRDLGTLVDFLRERLSREPLLTDVSRMTLRSWLGSVSVGLAPSSIARKLSSVRAFYVFLGRTGEVREVLHDATAAIRYNADLLRKTLDHVGLGIAVFDAEGKLEIWNERFAAGAVDPELQDHGWIPTDAGPDFFERMDTQEFERRFGHTPLERTGLERMRRNWAMAWGSITGKE